MTPHATLCHGWEHSIRLGDVAVLGHVHLVGAGCDTNDTRVPVVGS
jgi:hypothetical protein